jgi:hypothetical protein
VWRWSVASLLSVVAIGLVWCICQLGFGLDAATSVTVATSAIAVLGTPRAAWAVHGGFAARDVPAPAVARVEGTTLLAGGAGRGIAFVMERAGAESSTDGIRVAPPVIGTAADAPLVMTNGRCRPSWLAPTGAFLGLGAGILISAVLRCGRPRRGPSL